MIALLPVAPVMLLVLWARQMRRRAVTPGWATGVAYAMIVLALLFVLGGVLIVASEMLGAAPAEPAEKARRLAEGVSEAMNNDALGLLVGGLVALWLGCCTMLWRRRRPEPPPP